MIAQDAMRITANKGPLQAVRDELTPELLVVVSSPLVNVSLPFELEQCPLDRDVQVPCKRCIRKIVERFGFRMFLSKISSEVSSSIQITSSVLHLKMGVYRSPILSAICITSCKSWMIQAEIEVFDKPRHGLCIKLLLFKARSCPTAVPQQRSGKC